MRPSLATALLAGGSLVAGFAVAELTGVRTLGGLVLLVALVACVACWRRIAGTRKAVWLAVLYVVAFVASHFLARLVGPWPAVTLVAGDVFLTSLLATHGSWSPGAPRDRTVVRR